MRDELDELAKKSVLSRFFLHASIAKRLEEYLETLEDASRSFNVGPQNDDTFNFNVPYIYIYLQITCLIALQAAMCRTADYDDKQVT